MFAVDLTTLMYMAVGWHAKRCDLLTLQARQDAGGFTMHL